MALKKVLILWGIVLSLPASASTSTKDCFSIATANLWHRPNHYAERLANLKKELKKGAPDIVGFEEAWSVVFGSESLYRNFLKITGYHIFYSRTNSWGGNAGWYEGLALTSHFPISHRIARDLPYSRWYAKRRMISGVVETGAGPVRVIEAHLSPFAHKQKIRARQVRFIADWVRRYAVGERVVVMGDFNNTPSRKVFQALLDSGFTVVDPTFYPTYNRHNPFNKSGFNGKLDYIFYRPKDFKLAAKALIFYRHPVSDHYGLTARLCAL